MAYSIEDGLVVSSSSHSTSGSSQKRTMWSRITVGTGAIASSSVVHLSLTACLSLRHIPCIPSVSPASFFINHMHDHSYGP